MKKPRRRDAAGQVDLEKGASEKLPSKKLIAGMVGFKSARKDACPAGARGINVTYSSLSHCGRPHFGLARAASKYLLEIARRRPHPLPPKDSALACPVCELQG